MRRPYIIFQVVDSTDLFRNFPPTTKGQFEAEKLVLSLNEKWGANSAWIRRYPCTLSELESVLEGDLRGYQLKDWER